MLDFIGASLSLICTYYFTKAQRLAWLLGMIAIAVNSVLYFQKGIYGALLLEGVYFISMIYGWYQWATANNRPTTLAIRHLQFFEGCLLTVAAVAGIFLLHLALITWTDSDIPLWDATTTILALTAQWLLCRKVLHCWILWFIVDAMIAALQFYKGIPFHSAVHWLYLIMAIMGYYRWQKLYKQEQLNLMPLTV